MQKEQYLRLYTIDQRESQDTSCHGHHTHSFPVRRMRVKEKCHTLVCINIDNVSSSIQKKKEGGDLGFGNDQRI